MSDTSLPTPALSIVIPVYNGADTVPQLVEALARLPVPGGLEIVLVNDGSPDHSLAVCQRLCEQQQVAMSVVDLSRNFGEHNAVMAGLSQARGTHIITMDDDLQNPPEEVLKLWQYTRNGGFDVVYTRYNHKQDARWRNWGSRLANTCANLVLDKPKDLYLSSFRCLNAFTAQALLNHTGPFPYIDGLILQITQRIGSLEVAHLPREQGQSNYTLRRLIRLFLSMLLNFSVMPLRIATATGLLIASLGLLGLLAVVVEFFTVGQLPSGWASLMAGILLLAGVQLVMLGVIGEYLGRLFLTVNQKPRFVIRSVQRNRTPES